MRTTGDSAASMLEKEPVAEQAYADSVDDWGDRTGPVPTKSRSYRIAKRFLDIVVSGVLLVAAIPLMLLIAIAVRLGSSGPILYGSKRWGHNGDFITIWKFRTMVEDADAVLEGDPQLRQAYEDGVKLDNDPRITAVGKVLRRLSLDELPQLWNVLKGDMSLVGPRPKLKGEEEFYGPLMDTVLSVPQGMTGLWQISGRNNTTYEERIELDAQYARESSFAGDLVILVKTVPTVFKGHGAC